MVVLSAIKQPKVVKNMTVRLRLLMCRPMEVAGLNDTMLNFVPQISVGSVTVHAADAVAAQVIDEAEQRALSGDRDHHSVPETDHAPLSA